MFHSSPFSKINPDSIKRASPEKELQNVEIKGVHIVKKEKRSIILGFCFLENEDLRKVVSEHMLKFADRDNVNDIFTSAYEKDKGGRL